jgi:hypothetical protein
MAKIGSVELTASMDVKKGEETSIESIFYEERKKEFEVLQDVTCDKTKLKVSISKIGTFEATADTTKKKGEKTSCWSLLKYSDLSKKLKASKDIKKGDKLKVSFKTS